MKKSKIPESAPNQASSAKRKPAPSSSAAKKEEPSSGGGGGNTSAAVRSESLARGGPNEQGGITIVNVPADLTVQRPTGVAIAQFPAFLQRYDEEEDDEDDEDHRENYIYPLMSPESVAQMSTIHEVSTVNEVSTIDDGTLAGTLAESPSHHDDLLPFGTPNTAATPIVNPGLQELQLAPSPMDLSQPSTQQFRSLHQQPLSAQPSTQLPQPRRLPTILHTSSFASTSGTGEESDELPYVIAQQPYAEELDGIQPYNDAHDFDLDDDDLDEEMAERELDLEFSNVPGRLPPRTVSLRLSGDTPGLPLETSSDTGMASTDFFSSGDMALLAAVDHDDDIEPMLDFGDPNGGDQHGFTAFGPESTPMRSSGVAARRLAERNNMVSPLSVEHEFVPDDDEELMRSGHAGENGITPINPFTPDGKFSPTISPDVENGGNPPLVSVAKKTKPRVFRKPNALPPPTKYGAHPQFPPMPSPNNIRHTTSTTSMDSADTTSSKTSLAGRLRTATKKLRSTTKNNIVRLYRGTSRASDSSREGPHRSVHLRRLLYQRRLKHKYLSASKYFEPDSDDDEEMPGRKLDGAGVSLHRSEMGSMDSSFDPGLMLDFSEDMVDESTRNLSSKTRQVNGLLKEYNKVMKKREKEFQVPLEVRMQKFSYRVKVKVGSDKIKTVYNSSFLYSTKKLWKRYRGIETRPTELYKEKTILEDINLVIQPGKNYLVLGPPGSGKTSLLHAISGFLRPDKNKLIEGKVCYNGRTLDEHGEFHIENAIQYIGQLDNHAPRLTVEETFEFAYQCKSAGTIFRERHWLKNDEELNAVKKADQERLRVRTTLIGLGLDEVRNTFVGDTSVRGVSGGQRRRVTVGELLQERVPVLCGDEISTGLDAASTFDMIELILHFGKASNMARVISLLQPSPETVSLFDEVIVLAEGRIIYAGPILQVERYFARLGYRAPEYTDVADFLQQVSTEDGKAFYHPSPEVRAIRPNPPEIPELAEMFKRSGIARRIEQRLKASWSFSWAKGDGYGDKQSDVSGLAGLKTVRRKYANGFARSTFLILKRFLVLWKRDKRVIIAGAAKNILMGVSVGGVFANTVDETSILGALFQAGLFIMLSAMQNAATLVTDRDVYYKHASANFYSAWPFVFGRTLSQVPQTVSDVMLFGTLLYYIIGFAGRNSFSNFLVYLAILIAFAFTMQQQLAVFASFSSASELQVYSAIILLFFILFCGFIVAPDVIPTFYLWVYWWNPFAWAYRALVVNEFRSGRYKDEDQLLTRIGFTTPNSDPFTSTWILWCFLYLGVYCTGCLLLTAVGLSYSKSKRADTTLQLDTKAMPHNYEQQNVSINFTPLTLSIHNICYEVTASTGHEKLMLLNNVNGIFQSGRMCALMGTSGAGKTTLMDVIALRKRTGKITGEVRMNGWPQDPISFRRASGYVEQFDIQSPELTVRETVLFSARLRLGAEQVDNEEDVQAFVDKVIHDVGLHKLSDVLVGSDGTGLSFEKKKLLSIAVELAASPSLIFLDEPTSGLDARSALKVVQALRSIASTGRTIIATIHQPSSTVFQMFDDLLLLRKGGHVVYHGELGPSSGTLVAYFEELGAPHIDFGENPANWMLRVMAMEALGDLSEKFLHSEEFLQIRAQLDEIEITPPHPSRKIVYEEEYATPKSRMQELVNNRLRLIYWRSPAYNLARMMVSALVGFILGSVFILKRQAQVFKEVEMKARLAVMFLTFIITGIMAILSVLPVMTKIRDMYYRHDASGLYDSGSIGWALGSVEKGFIIVSCTIFVTIFEGTANMNDRIWRGVIGFWGFYTFNFAIYSYFGQAFVCLVKPTATAIILSSVFIGLNNFFAGLIVRPQFMVGSFYALPYYICPGHYVYEGMVMSMYRDDERLVIADPGSEFFESLKCSSASTATCSGTVEDYISVFFGGEFSQRNVSRNAVILGFVLLLTRVMTWLALKYIRFSN